MEQMIEAARKQPADLAEAIQQLVKKATSSSSGGGRAVLDSMQVCCISAGFCLA
jgi:hypothetical protein